MARVVVTEFVSLDGVMEAPGGGEDFETAAGVFDFDRGDEGNAFKTGETMDAAAMLLGRRTYEAFAGAWPERTGEFADKFNGMPKYVVSSTLEHPEWGETTVLRGDIAEEVGRVKEQHEDAPDRPRQRAARARAAGARPGRRAAPDGLPGRARQGQVAVGPTSDKRTFKLTASASVGEGVQTPRAREGLVRAAGPDHRREHRGGEQGKHGGKDVGQLGHGSIMHRVHITGRMEFAQGRLIRRCRSARK